MWYINAFKYYGVYIYTVLRNVKNSKHGISVECPKILNNQFQTVMNGAYDVSKSFIFYSILRKINENFWDIGKLISSSY